LCGIGSRITAATASAATGAGTKVHLREQQSIVHAGAGNGSGRILICDRIIQAVGKHVIAQVALTGGDEGIGVEESAPDGVVISALQIIQPGFGIIDITTIPQGVICAEGRG